MVTLQTPQIDPGEHDLVDFRALRGPEIGYIGKIRGILGLKRVIFGPLGVKN